MDEYYEDDYYEAVHDDEWISDAPSPFPSAAPTKKRKPSTAASAQPTKKTKLTAPSPAPSAQPTKKKVSKKPSTVAPTSLNLPPTSGSVTAVLTLLSGAGSGLGVLQQPILYLSTSVAQPNATSPATVSSRNQENDDIQVTLSNLPRGQTVYIGVDGNGLNESFTIRVNEVLTGSTVPSLLYLLDAIPQVHNSLFCMMILSCQFKAMWCSSRRTVFLPVPPAVGSTIRLGLG